MKVLSADTPEAAGARCIIKRTLRQMALPVGEPAEYVAWFVAHPWACTTGIERALQQSVRAYERNDTVRENRYANQVVVLMGALGFRLDWPGLYPTFIYNSPKPENLPGGRWGGGECYQLSHVWTLLEDIRKAENQPE
jgi:hypothetical protein